MIPAGSYDFGFINDTFADSLTYTAVTKLPGYWKFTSTGYGVGSTLCVLPNCPSSLRRPHDDPGS